jgi:plasmid stability protein
MRTLYLRNVPDEVAEQLEELASRSGMSLNALAVKELTAVAARADNARLLAELPTHAVTASDVVADLADGRRSR